jgi:hypothetical protein
MDDIFDTDPWANTIGEDDELDRLWAALTQATDPVEPRALEAKLAPYLAGLGARSRRTTEGLILAATAATVAGRPGRDAHLWEDWRVILHRHFARDQRMDMGVAVAILLELRKTEARPDWHTSSARVMERVIDSLARDMRDQMEAIEQGTDAPAASAVLATLASELFDVAIALRPDQMEELRNSPDVAVLLADLWRHLGERAAADAKPVVTNLVKARALVEVTIRQLELGAPILH